MQRTASALVAASFAAFLSTLATGAYAQCANADQCTVAVCQQRQARVHPTCDVPRSCSATPVANKPELRRRLTINQQCLAARMNVSQCFSNSDPGHDQAIQQVQAAIDLCSQKLAQVASAARNKTKAP